MIGKIEEVKQTHFNSRMDCHDLEDINHLGAGLKRCVRGFCADRLVETIWMVILQLGEV